MKFLRVLLFLLFSVLIAVSCNRPPEERRLPDQQELRKTLEETNKILLESEKQEIKDFIARYGWDMQETGSGLWYQVYQEGSGEKASAGKMALINYTISLLTGDMIYSSDTEGAREFRIGRGGVELGLEEGILLLKEGDKARFIMPSHLAHGVPGDGVKIPARATIVYEVELIELK
ncbi:MAG: FKBP-type peptidyl-prolyl cis-trans isomerase [Bacteroidales bacterium]|nr:FKBP-type peptidyl-prolyl cis-trans isomerase [Bacteroidales bacterium]